MTTLPSRLRSPTEAYTTLESDFSQRKRELINLKTEVSARRRTALILKAAILLAYAHVEGAVKVALGILLIRLNSSGLLWKNVKTKLAYFEIDYRISRQVATQTRRPVICGDHTTDFLHSLQTQRIALDVTGFVQQIGVVNATTLRKILEICDMNVNSYEAHLGLLDDRLVARRHELAHGDLFPVDQLTAETAVDLALALLEPLLADFGNLLVSESYLSRS
jgi:hypothetical protein